MSEPSLEQMLEAELVDGSAVIGEVVIRSLDHGAFEVAHRNAGLRLATGRTRRDEPVRSAGVSPAEEIASEEALKITKVDDTGKYRPLRTAPSLPHGWKIKVENLSGVMEVIDAIYPGRLAAWGAWRRDRLTTTSLRETLNRQSGMYRVAAKISDLQISGLVGNFCRSDGGCLRTILWRRDEQDAPSSSELPPSKFDPAFDQTGRGERCIPLLCQEACNLLVAACREVVKTGGASRENTSL